MSVKYPHLKNSEVKAAGLNLPISNKNADVICKKIRGKPLIRAKEFVQALLDKKTSINGKYYTKTARYILELLENAENNAKYKGWDEKELNLRIISVEQGFSRIRRKRKITAAKLKVTHIKVGLKRKKLK